MSSRCGAAIINLEIYTLRWLGPLGTGSTAGTDQGCRAGEGLSESVGCAHVRSCLLRRNRLHEMGLRTTRMFGEGTEFERLREYLPDDEYRRINWKATARRHNR